MASSSTGASTAEVYGFAGYLTSLVAYGVYVLWLFVPETTLQYFGITYYPSKDWAIIVPTWFCLIVAYLFWVYESYNMMSVPSKRSWTNISDAHSTFAAEGESFPGVQGSIPSLKDIPPHIASRHLHLARPGE